MPDFLPKIPGTFWNSGTAQDAEKTFRDFPSLPTSTMNCERKSATADAIRMTMAYGPLNVALHVINTTRISNAHFSSEQACYDVASNIYRTLP